MKKYLTNRHRYAILNNERGGNYGDDGETWKGEILLQRELQRERLAEPVQKISQNLTRAQQVSEEGDDLYGKKRGQTESEQSNQAENTQPPQENVSSPQRQIIYPTLDDILDARDEIAIEHNEKIGFLGPQETALGKLESAIARMQSFYFGQDLFPTLFEKAAVLVESINQAHSFDNANKRISTLVALNFLEDNGIEQNIDANEDELEEIIVSLVEHKIDYVGLVEWLKRNYVGPNIQPLDKFGQYLPNSVPEVQIYTIQNRFQDDQKLGQYVSSHKSSVPGVYKVYDIYRKDGYTVYTVDPMNKMADMALAVNFETYQEAVDYVRDTMVKRAQREKLKPLSDFESVTLEDGTQVLYAMDWHDIAQGLIGVKPEYFTDNMVMLFFVSGGTFHMNGCLFPIDIAFLDEEGKILKLERMIPNESYVPAPSGTTYALETNVNWYQNRGLGVGDVVPFFKFDEFQAEEDRREEEQLKREEEDRKLSEERWKKYYESLGTEPEDSWDFEDGEIREGQKQKYALITGFDKFAGYVKNPSFEVARKLEGKTIAGYKIQIAKLPVEYGTSAQMVTDIVKEIKPDVVIALGLAFYGKIAIEATAYKCESTVEQIPSLKKTPEQVESNLPVSNIITKWQTEDIDGIKGYNPGAFVCEHIMYTLYTLEDLSKKGFIHVPRPEEMSLEVMIKAVVVSLEETAKAVEQEHTKKAQTEIKFGQWDYDDVMNKRVRNEYYVSVSNEYLVQEDNSLNPASEYPEHMVPAEVWGKIVAKYYDYPSAIAHAGIIYDGIEDVEKPSKETINSVFVEDYLSGELFSGQVEAFLGNVGTVDEEWEYTKESYESLQFTDGKLKEIGYPRGINSTKEEIDRMDFGVTIKPLDKFGQLVSHDMAGNTIQVGDKVSFPMEDPEAWPPAVIKGILQREDEPHDLIIVVWTEESGEEIEDCVGSDEVLKVEESIPIVPLEKFGQLTTKDKEGNVIKVGDMVSFPSKDPEQWPNGIVIGILTNEDRGMEEGEVDYDLLVVEWPDDIKETVASDEVLKVEDKEEPDIKPLEIFG